MASLPRRARTSLARTAVRVATRASRSVGMGHGSSIGGAVGRAILPDLLAELAGGVRVNLVTGTNGKSTTAALLTAALSAGGPVAFNSGGSNMENGAVVALASAPEARAAVLEVDEAFLDPIARATRPEAIVLLNLSREATRGVVMTQLVTAWRRLFESIDWPCRLIASSNDPLVVGSIPEGATVTWVDDGLPWTRDSRICPTCHSVVAWEGTAWRCPGCGLAQPEAAWSLAGEEVSGPAGRIPLRLALPGAWTRSNALFAVAAAVEGGIEPHRAVVEVGAVEDVAGRYRRFEVDGRDVRLVMVKNAASWASALTVASPGVGVVLCQEAFGPKDLAPLWEVDVSPLAGTQVVATGQRRYDVATRLEVSEVPYAVVEGPLDAIRSLPPGPVVVIANYTAFLDLREELARS